MVVVDVTMGVVLVVACGGGRVRMGMVVVTIVLRFVVNKDHENKVRILTETLSSNFLSNRKRKKIQKEKEYGERKKTVIGNEERETDRGPSTKATCTTFSWP